jgi:GxxExxY protein
MLFRRQRALASYTVAVHELIEARLTHSVIGAFYAVYNSLGYGFLESVYARALEVELKARGHYVEREVPFRVYYKGVLVGLVRVDMVVERKLIVESKSSVELHSFSSRQLTSYIQASSLPLGLLLHFGPQPRFQRIVGRLPQ